MPDLASDNPLKPAIVGKHIDVSTPFASMSWTRRPTS